MEVIRNAWLDFFQNNAKDDDWWGRKKALCQKRGTEIVQITGKGNVYEVMRWSGNTVYRYAIHFTFLHKQGEHFYLEEQVISYQFELENGRVRNHKRYEHENAQPLKNHMDTNGMLDGTMERFAYDRRAAVQYAERWWNDYNPAYRQFDVDCTNYVSQCAHAGGAPMWGAPNREQGWWYQRDNWSYSWAVAHSLRWYLSGSTKGLKGKEMESASDLLPGDIICYDFAGDNRWDHNTIVVAKDAEGMPLVNAHTDNSRNRYWSYEDSRAWTPDIQYKFFRIGE